MEASLKVRSTFQINQRTSWIDASFLYSTQEPWVHALRSFVNGTLREGPMPNYPPFNAQRLPLINPPPPQVHRLVDPERLFSKSDRGSVGVMEAIEVAVSVLGDARVNENPALLSFGLMLFRWHNVQANRLRKEHPDWSDEQLFQRARRWVIATLQVRRAWSDRRTLWRPQSGLRPQGTLKATPRTRVTMTPCLEHYHVRVPAGPTRGANRAIPRL